MFSEIRLHIPALFTATVWGSTFVASRAILSSGVSTLSLMLFRFVLAYALLWLFCRERHPIRFCRDEFLFTCVGLMGGTLYFFLEYSALQRTSAVNVGLITSTVPIASTGLAIVVSRAKVTRHYVLGSALAMLGTALVILNGHFDLKFVPSGDFVAIASVLSWALYTLALSKIGRRYNPLFVSRRLFFYAIITLLPFALANDVAADIQKFANWRILLSATYLGGVASATCVWLWNVSMNKIGVSTTNNYLYLLPIVSVATSAIFAGAELTTYNLIGSVFIVIGIILADKKMADKQRITENQLK